MTLIIPSIDALPQTESVCHSREGGDFLGICTLPQAARTLLEHYPNERVFCFFAPMGAGKTTFIKELCNALDVQDAVTSPTFAIVNEYHTADDKSVYHFDLYRLKNASEAFDIGFNEYVSSGSYCFIEWSEVIDGHIPVSYVRVEISVNETTLARNLAAKIVQL
jgi:tRNA threonylcarbamoyladenosine biosynthesis protein TsaE